MKTWIFCALALTSTLSQAAALSFEPDLIIPQHMWTGPSDECPVMIAEGSKPFCARFANVAQKHQARAVRKLNALEYVFLMGEWMTSQTPGQGSDEIFVIKDAYQGSFEVHIPLK